jgi:hypothetical protein
MLRYTERETSFLFVGLVTVHRAKSEPEREAIKEDGENYIKMNFIICKYKF